VRAETCQSYVLATAVLAALFMLLFVAVVITIVVSVAYHYGTKERKGTIHIKKNLANGGSSTVNLPANDSIQGSPTHDV